MFNLKSKTNKTIDGNQYQIINGRTFNETKFMYKTIDKVYIFTGKSICNLLSQSLVNRYMIVLNTGTELLVSKEFYDKVFKRYFNEN